MVYHHINKDDIIFYVLILFSFCVVLDSFAHFDWVLLPSIHCLRHLDYQFFPLAITLVRSWNKAKLTLRWSL